MNFQGYIYKVVVDDKKRDVSDYKIIIIECGIKSKISFGIIIAKIYSYQYI